MSDGRPVELDELTRIGFGCYRVDVRNAEHRAALEVALAGGCNLVDTASNYSDGRSEELVGSVLEETGARAFVVTKAGYLSPAAVDAVERAGVSLEGQRRLEGGTPYSLDPDVLRVVLELSRARLRRPVLDAVLLHNPERLAEGGASADELRTAIGDAFAFLREEVAAGRLRFYGVSSNVVATAAPGEPLDLDAIQDAAEGARFLQFPLNLIEREAATEGARPSLLARASGVVRTMANRPLNALFDGTPVRLAEAPSEDSDDDPWETCVALVERRLAELGQPEAWSSFRPMQFLRDHRDAIADADLVDLVWENQIDPFLQALFDDPVPPEAREAFDRLRAFARACARARAAGTTASVAAQLAEHGILDREPGEPLAVAACRFCLDAGVDHVLVGMRRPRYVAELAPLFATADSSRR